VVIARRKPMIEVKYILEQLIKEVRKRQENVTNVISKDILQ
jgi:hypothetical protein